MGKPHTVGMIGMLAVTAGAVWAQQGHAAQSSEITALEAHGGAEASRERRASHEALELRRSVRG